MCYLHPYLDPIFEDTWPLVAGARHGFHPDRTEELVLYVRVGGAERVAYCVTAAAGKGSAEQSNATAAKVSGRWPTGPTDLRIA